MKKTTIFTMIFLIFSSCNTGTTELNGGKGLSRNSAININHDDNTISKLHEDSISPTKIDRLKTLSFKFNVDKSKHILKTINIYNDNQIIQRIIADKQIEYSEFKLIDWNFDGYKDISVLYNCGSGGCAYWIWNYSPKKNKYVYNMELSEVLGLERDTIGKYIVFHYRVGYSKEKWDSLIYKDNKLLFVKGLQRERWNDSLGNSWVKNTYSRMINKVEIITTDSFITK
ncbi:MAG: XAC2610-related protein [Bacteroidia bacterium]